MINNNKFNKAFTLAETIVVVALFALVMMLINEFIYRFYLQNSYAIQQSAAIQSARDGVKTLVSDLREVVASEGGSYPIQNAALDSIEVYSDIDRDDSVERVKYFINAEGKLIKESTESIGTPPSYPDLPTSSEIVADYIVNDMFATNLFTYFDEEGNVVVNLEDVDAIRFVEVNLVVNVDPARQPEEFVLRSSAYLRNLKPTLQ